MSVKWLLCALLAIAGLFYVARWLDLREWQGRYARVAGGMTVDEVRQVMGKMEDTQDRRRTISGEFERSWTFPGGVRVTVVFDSNGRTIYIEHGLTDCGVTPLMGKYVKE
jgi:hypothetical protein